MKAVFRVVQTISYSAVAWSFLATLLRAGSAVFILPLMLHLLPQEELGMWYVFGSISSFASLLDAGIAPMTTRVAGYFWAGAREIQPFGICSDVKAMHQDLAPNYKSLRDLAETLRRYYRALGVSIFLLMLTCGGAWIWHKSAGIAACETVRGSYILLCVGALLNFTGDLWPNLLSGLGQVRRAQQISLLGLSVYYVAAAGGLLLGMRLWALVLGTILMGLITRRAGKVGVQRLLSGDGVSTKGRYDIHLLATMWPNAWRIALVSLGAFLILQANTLVCSAFLDLKTTASYGLSIQVIILISSISSTWILVKLPQINQWRARNLDRDIADLFARRMRLCLTTYIVLAAGFLLLGPYCLNLVHSKTHLIPLGPLALAAVTQFLEMHHSLYASLVLSENRNPFLKPALISGAGIVLLSCVLTPRIGVYGMIGSTAIVQACFNNWWPVWRGVQGLRVGQKEYWKHFFGFMGI